METIEQVADAPAQTDFDFKEGLKYGFVFLKKYCLVAVVLEVGWILSDIFTGLLGNFFGPWVQMTFTFVLLPEAIGAYDKVKWDGRVGYFMLRCAAIGFAVVSLLGLLLCIVGNIVTDPLALLAMGCFYDCPELGFFGALKKSWKRICELKFMPVVWITLFDIIANTVNGVTLEFITPVLMVVSAAWSVAVFRWAFPRESAQSVPVAPAALPAA